MRTFQPREYQGRPVVIRLLKHPATGELLMPAGTTLRGCDGAQWTAVPPRHSDRAGRIWVGGGDHLRLAERAASGPGGASTRPPAAGPSPIVAPPAASAPNSPPSALPAPSPPPSPKRG